MEGRLRATPDQFVVLIEFMERNGDLSKPEPGPQGRIKSDRQWDKLSRLLNSVKGGVQKSRDRWKKVWADWKTKTKKKYLTIQQHARRSSGSPGSRHLTTLEERVIAVLKMSKTPPAQSQQATCEQASSSSSSTTSTPVGRRSLLSSRRNRGFTTNQVVSEFMALEKSRLRLEEMQDLRHHERETERLRLDALRIETTREHNQLLRQLCTIGQSLLDMLTG